MNERLTIQDLTDLLAAKHSMTKKDAEAFVKEFFLLIEQALENEKTVKIKGLGTFKLVDVDSRESVNVNTGERFQIKGHTKVSFTPDTNLRDTINKPFAHFETVVLNEGTVLEDTPMEESDEEEGAVSDTETEMIDSEIAGNENAGGDIQEEIQLEEPVIEEQPTAEAVAVAEVPETDANKTGPTGLQLPDRIISVPLWQRRHWRRGFNQSDLLCQPLSRWLHCRWDSEAVTRTRATATQHFLSARLRKRNLKNAFRLELPVQGRHMVIVDDVVTTGSTVAEIAQLLLRNGAATVQVWCLCRTL